MDLKIFVFEDHPVSAMKVEQILKNHGYSNIIVCSIMKQVLNVIGSQDFDLAILDIHSSEDEHAGINIAKILNKNGNIPIIYTTAHTEYINNTISTDHDSILTKPFSEKELMTVVNKIINKLVAKKRSFLSDKLFIKKRGTHYGVEHDHILYVTAEQGYIKIVTSKGDFTNSATLNKFEKQVSNERFVRIDRGTIINISLIYSYDHEKVVLEGGKEFSLSKKRYQEIKRRLDGNNLKTT